LANFFEIIGSQLNLVVGSVAIYVGILAILPMLIEDHSKKKKRKNLEELIEKSFNEKLVLDKDQLEILLKNFNLTSQDLHILLRRLFTSAVKNNTPEFLSYIQNLYEDTEKQAPFEGLPSDVKLHLERIKEALGDQNRNLMEPLATQLQDINITNKRKNKTMWILTIGSFVVGLIGVIMSFIPYMDSEVEQKNKRVSIEQLSLSEDKTHEMAKFYHGVDLSKD
jgi:hypothetical protein